MDAGAWWAAVHGVAKSRTRLSDFTFTFHFHALEKEMATHSSVLPGESQGRRSLVGCHLWGRTESDTTEATWQQQQQRRRHPFSLQGHGDRKAASTPVLAGAFAVHRPSTVTKKGAIACPGERREELHQDWAALLFTKSRGLKGSRRSTPAARLRRDRRPPKSNSNSISVRLIAELVGQRFPGVDSGTLLRYKEDGAQERCFGDFSCRSGFSRKAEHFVTFI